MMIANIPIAFGWFIMYIGNSYSMYLTGIIVLNIGWGLGQSPVIPYVSEIRYLCIYCANKLSTN